LLSLYRPPPGQRVDTVKDTLWGAVNAVTYYVDHLHKGALINEILDEALAEQEGDFDPDTRWALAWFEQFGFNDGPFGVAEILSTAKNTSVSGLEKAGILLSKGGHVGLLRPDELPVNWDPTADARLTIWEIVH